MKKKILFSLLVIFLCIALVGCGDKKDDNSKNNNEGNGGTNTNTEIGLDNVSTTNYKSVAKNLFGVDIIDVSGWEIKKAESPNKVNNLNLDFKITTSGNGKEILEQYYNKILNISDDGIYSYSLNSSYQMVKETKYNSFEDVYKDSNSYDDFYQMEFIYVYNGKNVYFTMTIREDLEVADISFTYC